MREANEDCDKIKSYNW